MIRSRLFHHAGLAVLAFLALVLPARAGTLPADALPFPNRVATADVVVAGKVTALEDKTVMAAPFPGARNKVEYRIAVVTIGDARLDDIEVVLVEFEDGLAVLLERSVVVDASKSTAAAP